MTSTHPVDADDLRPDPDALLARVQQQEAQARRGRLKIFFGASAGVGKTYAMLSAAHAARARVGPRSGPPCFFDPPTIVGAISSARLAQAEAPRQPFAAIRSRRTAPTVAGL